MCDWFDQYGRNQEGHHREGPKLSTEDLTKLTHRKDLTASGNRLRQNEDSKTIEYTPPRSDPHSQLVRALKDSVCIGPRTTFY